MDLHNLSNLSYSVGLLIRLIQDETVYFEGLKVVILYAHCRVQS